MGSANVSSFSLDTFAPKSRRKVEVQEKSLLSKLAEALSSEGEIVEKSTPPPVKVEEPKVFERPKETFD